LSWLQGNVDAVVARQRAQLVRRTGSYAAVALAPSPAAAAAAAKANKQKQQQQWQQRQFSLLPEVSARRRKRYNRSQSLLEAQQSQGTQQEVQQAVEQPAKEGGGGNAQQVEQQQQQQPPPGRSLAAAEMQLLQQQWSWWQQQQQQSVGVMWGMEEVLQGFPGAAMQLPKGKVCCWLMTSCDGDGAIVVWRAGTPHQPHQPSPDCAMHTCLFLCCCCDGVLVLLSFV
jgi:hypothetical protein